MRPLIHPTAVLYPVVAQAGTAPCRLVHPTTKAKLELSHTCASRSPLQRNAVDDHLRLTAHSTTLSVSMLAHPRATVGPIPRPLGTAAIRSRPKRRGQHCFRQLRRLASAPSDGLRVCRMQCRRSTPAGAGRSHSDPPKSSLGGR